MQYEFPELTENCYLFDTHFYTKLSTNKEKINFEAVENWSKNVNIFEKDFIFVPINVKK